MKKLAGFSILTIFSIVISVSSCSMDETMLPTDNPIKVNGRVVPSEGYQQDFVSIRFTEEMADKIEVITSEEGVITTNMPSVKSAINEIKIISMRRTFPYDEEFEERHRKYGLHLWYDVKFDNSVTLVRASEVLSEIEGVDFIDYSPNIIPFKGTPVEDDYSHLGPVMVRSNSTPIFNDTHFPKQWHYYNDGSGRGAKAGSDINVLPVWEKGIVGSDNVVVAVFDGGVDYTHEDLAENMWVDPVNGTHGRNFMKELPGGNWSTEIEPDDHGTHVAGTIAAINNNGIGVAGVAGGDKAAGVKGAKIMTCQIMGSDGGAGAYSKGLVWAADNGAVISQNSWGYDEKATDTPEKDKVAITYFIENAGMKNGVQVGPMAGGVVFFAAGNEATDKCYPPSYEKVIAVTSIGNNFAPAYYTNFGSWCDIIAPGGDQAKGSEIYSTITNNKYKGYQGTSMACPHVSGIAALIISQYGGPGFTADSLKSLILNTTRDITAYTGTGVNYGVGLVDATQAMSKGSTVPPDSIIDLTLSARSNTIDYSFTVPSDPDDTKPSNVILYYSKNDFDPYEGFPEDIDSARGTLRAVSVGEIFKGAFTGLEFYTKYYVTAVAMDFAGNKSGYSEVVSVETLGNNPPQITTESETFIELKSHESVTLKFVVSDPDGHAVTVALNEECEGVRLTQGNAGSVSVNITAAGLEAGEYNVFFTVTDAYGLSTEQGITFVIIPNNPPLYSGGIENLIFNSIDEKAKTIELGEYFTDADGEALTYTVVDENNKVIRDVIKTPSVSGQQLKIAPKSVGQVTVKIIAKDGVGDTAEATFNVLVRPTDADLEFYPNPVVDFLNLRPSKELSEVNIEVVNNSGAVVLTSSNVDAVTPFAPLAVDMKSLPAGQYSVKAVYTTADGKSGEMQQIVAKL